MPGTPTCAKLLIHTEGVIILGFYVCVCSYDILRVQPTYGCGIRCRAAEVLRFENAHVFTGNTRK